MCVRGASQKYAEKFCHSVTIIASNIIFYQNKLVRALIMYAKFHVPVLNSFHFVVTMVTK